MKSHSKPNNLGQRVAQALLALTLVACGVSSWGTGAFTYSGAGNVLTQTVAGVTKSSTYDTQNRLLTYGGGSVSHDVYGNVIGTPEDAYTFDNAGNLRSRASGVANGYQYDGANTRVIAKDVSSTTYEFRSAHGLLLAQWTKQPGSYDTLKEHLHLAGKEVAERRTFFLPGAVQPAALMFLQPDANGSPITATSATGGLLFKENYRPFGSQINALAGGLTKRAFAGHTQERPNLIYMGGRYYNPLFARFLSIDPKEADPSDLHSLNRYAYANNNPYRYVDPDGYTPLDLVFLSIDAYRLGSAILTVGDVGSAALDVGLSAIGVISPVPGVGQGLKALKVADKAVNGARGADKVVDAAKEITLSRSIHGEAAAHAADAIRVLTIDRAGAAANRQASTGALDKVAGKHLDEYLPAMFREGGAGASVRPINPRDNMSSGACIGNACRGLPDGTRIKIKIGD